MNCVFIKNSNLTLTQIIENRHQKMTYSNRWATRSANQHFSRNEWKVHDTSPSTASPKVSNFSDVNYIIGEQSSGKLKQIAKRFLNGSTSNVDRTEHNKRGQWSQNNSETELSRVETPKAVELPGNSSFPDLAELD